MTREDALVMLREVAQMWETTDRSPSIVSYWAGRIDGVKWAIKVLESEDGDVA